TKDWPKNYVINFGFVKREEVPEIMAAADILVLPGGNNPFDNERFPSKLSEYFAMGKLTLISKYFLESYIKTYKKFIVLSSFCAEEVVEKIKQLIKNRQNQRLLFFDNLNISSYMQMLNQLVLSFPEKYKYKKIFSRRKRILIVDPVCANKYGHNLHAIRRYSNYLQRYFNGSEVVALVSKYLELNGIDTSVIKPILNFYYHPIIKIDNNCAKIEAEIESSLPIEDLHFLQIEKAKKDVFMFHEEYDLSNNDIVFYPSIDYYSIIGLLNYLDKTKPSLSPKYILRWISVMEHNSFLPIKIESIFEKIRLKKCEGFKIINSAESIPYAKYLASYFQEPIIVTPTLIEEEFFDYESDKKYFRISFPGSGRPDKGIEKIPDILDNLESLGVKNIRVDLQFPDPLTLNALFHKILNLCQKSYVELQPFIISSESIMNNLRRADCVVLPYISDVYKYRSSAFVAECGVIGRPIVCSKGCGFSDEVEYFKIGFTAETPSEFAERIYELYSTPLEQRIITYKHTSYIYRKYIESCYRLLFMEVS
ncbi:MAG: glycosyltransferase, partial [Candidatus Aenigmatarchaeota archaeon]